MRKKPFAFVCQACLDVLESTSLDGAMTAMRRHRKKKHSDVEGGIKYDALRVCGKPSRKSVVDEGR
jgi:hypothetical protein